LVPPASVPAKVIGELLDWMLRSAPSVTGLMKLMAPAAVLVTLALSVMPPVAV
jgi:hypothetical protein